MDSVLLIRHKPIYRTWFIDVIRSLVAFPEKREKAKAWVKAQPDEYYDLLFKVGSLKPKAGFNAKNRFFEAHLKGFITLVQQVERFTTKYPELEKLDLADARWAQIVVEWAAALAGQAAAACNSQCDDGGGASDAMRCVDAWIAYDEAIWDKLMAEADLEDCRFQNSNPTDTVPSDSPFDPPGSIDPCMGLVEDILLAENAANDAWNDIAKYC